MKGTAPNRDLTLDDLLVSAADELNRLAADLQSAPLEAWPHSLKRVERLARASRKLSRAASDLRNLLREPAQPEPEEEPESQEAVEAQGVAPEPELVDQAAETPQTPEPDPINVPVASESPTVADPAEVPTQAPVEIRPAKKVSSTEGRRFRARLQNLSQRHTQLLESGSPPPLAWRSLLAEARSLKEFASVKLNDTTDIEPELERIAENFQRNDGGEFFGWNMGRRHDHDVWERVAIAYDSLGVATQALDEIEAREWSSQVPEGLVLDMSCAVMFLMHLNSHYAMGINEHAVWKAKERMEKQWPNVYMPALKTNEPNLRLPDVESAAKRFPKAYIDFASSLRQRVQRESAKEALAALLRHIEATDEPDCYVDKLREHVQACLDAGIPATNKDLVLMVLPFAAFFEEGAKGKMKSLVDAIHKKLTLVQTKGGLRDPAEAADADPEHEERVQRLRPILEGKTLLLVGGNKRQQWRKDDLKKALNLKEVLWPDLEDTSNYTSVFSEVDRADVVAQLIRWSRHHYSEVLDRAKDQGKPVIRVLAGLGTKRLVMDLDQQLPKPNP